ncbi:hypothetical protein BN7_3927 [Wickerhamomyces ciferrii]|uniref:Protein CSF1 n=1 Tax=Wickerhamomyces ciferrii (strain ATCC 14091 / BCRC 22168 / CBS 111 / JCM 3599 / NBRC 0793 / NRRL Y-1031 F-60-10) TaxID=1206466 RepID=K0KSN4_WICCF|nr:uncharacterized protein BN7_3927 [Wickerhamomyces ciferrii]CCH44364.1 hypothetical protein BN7_3927 [Wickerhamomyces ciferrii]
MIDKDQTVCALKGCITWRYWLPYVRQSEISVTSDENNTSIGYNSKLPCRIIIELDGLEAFIYNRTVSYDNVLNTLSSQNNTNNNNGQQSQTEKEHYDVFSNSASDNTTVNSDDPEISKPSSSFMAKILPIQVKINKGAIVAGNKTTQAILVMSYSSADGIMDFLRSDNSLDDCRQSFKVNFEKFQVFLKPNISFQENSKEHSGIFYKQKPNKKKYANRWILYRSLIKLWKFYERKKKPEDEHAEWRGLAQYLDNDSNSITNVKERELEYGKYTNLLDCDSAIIQYYYDIPGAVPEEAIPSNPQEGLDVGNGGSAPKFGLNVQLYGSTIFYGPWAERQRHSLHQMLYPTICRDGTPQGRLKPGKQRMYTQYQMAVEIMDEAIIRVPIREFSKNEEYAEATKDAPDTKRPFGWIELKMDKNSTITTTVGLVASKNGYDNRLNMSMLNLEVRSSVNHDIMLRCKEHQINANIGYPLKWNGHAIWVFLNESKEVDTFFLREHITLLSDMFTDFSSGPATPYELFRPFTYIIDWKVSKYAIYMNVNDANIINNPLDFNDNCYLSFQGEQLDINVNIPLEAVLRKVSTISFNLATPELSMVMDTPPWHTLNNFLKFKEVGRSKDFTIDGSYTYHSEVGLDFVDTIVIACKGKKMVLECYGFVVKYILSIKENYFGDFTRFRTLEEYTQELHDEKPETSSISHNEEKTKEKNFKRTENEEDVHFSFDVEEGCLVLPSNIYDSSSNVSLYFNTLNMDLRFTNYYMDFEADITPVKGVYIDSCDPSTVLDMTGYETLKEHDIFVDGLAIHGHRMFGLPPDEIKYFCKWDLEPGNVEFCGKAQALEGLMSSLVKLGFGYKNLENSLLIDEPEINDTTSVSLIAPKIAIQLEDPDIESIVNIELSKVNFFFIDITNPRYTERISADIENIFINVQDKMTNKASFEAQTSLRFTNFTQIKDFYNQRAKHDTHTALQDGPFHRVPFFLKEELRDYEYNSSFGSITPSYSIPDCPAPLTRNSVDLIFEDLGLEEEDVDSYNSSLSSKYPSEEELNFFQDFNSEFLPAQTPRATTLSTAKNYADTVAGANIKVTSNYRDENFAPQYKADSRFEYDNFILNFGDIDITASPSSILVFLCFAEKFLTRSMSAVLDDLHITVLKKLFISRNKEPTVKNIRFLTPRVNFNFGNFEWNHNFEPSLKTEHLNLTVDNPSLVCSVTNTLDNEEEIVMALNIMSILITLNEAGANTIIPLELSIYDLELWLNKDKKKTNSLSLRKIDVNIQEGKLDWMVDYAGKFLTMAGEISKKLEGIKKCSKKAEVELLYQITLASTIFKVEHDPAVLTRPAYIIRHSRQHIRGNDSWKVMIRLKHIYENLDPQWIEEHQKMFLDQNVEAPDTALEEVVKVFSSWRTWEFEDIDHSYVFRHVFSKSSQEPNLNSVSELSVQEISLLVDTEAGDRNYVDLDFLEISGSKSFTEFISLNQNLNSISSCLSVKVSSIKGRLSQLLFAFKKFEKIIPGKERNKATETLDAPIAKEINQVALLVENYDLRVDCFDVGCAIKGNDFCSSLMIFNETANNDFTLVLSSQMFSIDILSMGIKGASYTQGSTRINFSSASDIKCGPKLVDIAVSSMTLSIDQDTDVYVQLAVDVKDSIENLSMLLEKHKEGPSTESANIIADKKDSFIDTLSSIVLKIKIEDVNWRTRALSPLCVSGSIQGYESKLSYAKKVLIAPNIIRKAAMNLKLKSHKVLDIDVTNFGAIIKSILDEDTKLVELMIDSQDTNVVVLDFLRHLKSIKNDLNDLYLSADKIQRCLNQFKDDEHSSHSQDRKSDTGDTILKRIKFDSSVIKLAIQAHRSTARLDINGLSSSFSDYDIFNGQALKSKPFGDFKIESLKLDLEKNTISQAISNILDLNIALKVFNVRLEEQLLQTLEIESNYCRMMLHPQTISVIIELLNDFRFAFSTLMPAKANNKEKVKTDGGYNFQSQFHAVHMLFYNFCVGFMFDEPSEEYPGVIAGCEKVFVITEDTVGKLSLVHAYVSIANGKNTSDFFSASNEISSPNRAFLPNMQVMYAIKKNDNKKDIMLRVTGEELDVKFVSSSIVLLEKTLKAVSTIEALKKNIRTYPKPPVPEPATSFQETYKIPSDVTSISCIMNFAGGVVKLYKYDEFESLEDTYAPSFELRTPAVKIAAEYSKTSGLKDHHIDFEVFTSSSSNKLYSTCVPVLSDIWSSVKRLGQHSQSSAPVEKVGQSNPLMKDTELLKVLANFHINLAIHVDKQELSLSCEPSAKVQAVVGIGGIDIRLGTNDTDDSELLSGTLKSGNVSASLQHIYSREISASVLVDEMLATVLVAGPDKLKVYAAGKVDNVSSYINLKQLQDVNLFKDLWTPEETISDSNDSIYSSKSAVDSIRDENIVSRFQKVSSTGAVPWNFNFTISNVKCEVDLGQSLGVLSLDLDRFWAASRKKTNWEQSMALGFDTLSLSSEGRLSGFLTVHDIRVHSVIQWSLEGDLLGIPLVLLSFGFESIEAKASFDYNVFLISRMLKSYITVYNQIDSTKLLKDKLVASVMCGSVEIFTTALAASNILDIYNTISRIRQDNKRLYKEDLNSSKKYINNDKKTLDILNVIATLRTELDVNFGKLLLHVYPGSLLDSQVLIIDIGGMTAHFEQQTQNESVVTDMKLQLHNTSVALSSFKKQLPEEELNLMSIDKYILHTAAARGGGIFVFPSLESAMQTWQLPKSNIIEYKFRSAFGGKVDVRWNLGSVTFIREMWATHARAFSSRLPKGANTRRTSVPIYEDVNIEEKLKDVELEDKYKYVALEPPIIEAPQLRDLGDATPPLEWFGLHRQRFPGITHQFVIVGLQQLVHEVEQQYGRVLGKV